jgi:phage/plasmid primase-like uncharacterized protein
MRLEPGVEITQGRRTFRGELPDNHPLKSAAEKANKRVKDRREKAKAKVKEDASKRAKAFSAKQSEKAEKLKEIAKAKAAAANTSGAVQPKAEEKTTPPAPPAGEGTK